MKLPKSFVLLILLSYAWPSSAQNIFPTTGNVSIALPNGSPAQASIDLTGNLILRDYSNRKFGGSSITFSSYADANSFPGAKIRNSLINATNATSQSQLILSSYFAGYKDEITVSNGMVGINTNNPQNTLDVNGKIRAKEIRVEANWPDFVFAKGYRLKSLLEVEKFITTHQHLPEIPSEAEITRNGLELAKMNSKLMQKIEELTLYVIQQEKRIQILNRHLGQLEGKRFAKLVKQ